MRMRESKGCSEGGESDFDRDLKGASAGSPGGSPDSHSGTSSARDSEDESAMMLLRRFPVGITVAACDAGITPPSRLAYVHCSRERQRYRKGVVRTQLATLIY